MTFEQRARTYLDGLGRSYGIAVAVRDGVEPSAEVGLRRVVVPRPVSPARLAVGLHELGQVVTGSQTCRWSRYGRKEEASGWAMTRYRMSHLPGQAAAATELARFLRTYGEVA
ncbi:MAG TPA: hypothetical protein VEF89_14665 [Solirubrobacteraceae bacterium]|nr:hypothetical protein [Solirubrobacteraceae bacterium]